MGEGRIGKRGDLIAGEEMEGVRGSKTEEDGVLIRTVQGEK